MVKRKTTRKIIDINVNKRENCFDKRYFLKSPENYRAFYGLGFIGAVIYYISTATSFWYGILGILKALVWPAFLIFELLKFLGA